MLVALGLVVAVVLLAIHARPDMRMCRWREDRTGHAEDRRKFVCAACGAVMFTGPGQPPRRCARGDPKE
ncbi:hypothetical protein [Rhodovulum marinum]|uniref:Uncharacterized protein n=1 Tax=Rhodovulum marinum TaxID=320662 RepID=A0A4V2SQR5_9RHOB|nr:hypothetical protein [Rhodovulum marinum]TCP39946.1 hypothetical protein EV662_10971 [Rhodovulum marinum]